MHLNTQSMVSTFNELLLTVNSYPLDIVALSETWLRDQPQLLDYVSIPGFVTEFRNREGIRGGGVGVYIKENINYKHRRDIENAHPELEHLWIEVPGRNKYSRALVGVIYNSERMLSPSDWLNSLENLLGYLTVYWDGMLMLTGGINIDMLRPSDHLTKRYQGILDMFELTQIVKRPIRVTRTSKTLTDHFITNHPQKVTNTSIIPCSIVSDHDAIYACVNVQLPPFQPRYKFIWDIRNFKGWMKDPLIEELQNKRDAARFTAHQISTDAAWHEFHSVRNKLKSAIRTAWKAFIEKALYSNFKFQFV